MIKKKEILLGRRVSKLSAAFFATLLVLGACKKEETSIGSDLNNGNLDVIVSDTFSIKTYSSELVDMESDEAAVALLGAYNDPVFGGVNCGIVTQIIPEAITQDFPSIVDITMDSVVIALRYTTINYFANLGNITVEVFEIDDALVRDNQAYTISTEPTIIGGNLVLSPPAVITPNISKKVIIGSDTLDPQLRIHLDPSVGMDLVADSKAGLMGDNFANSTFKGLYIKVQVVDGDPGFGLSPGAGTVLYFALEDALSRMTLYYHTTSGSDKFNFLINSNTARYNKIDFEREGTAIQAQLEDQTLGAETFYTQGSSIRAVIEFPFIKDFYTDEDGTNNPKIINKAVLILPVQDFHTDPFNPSKFLFISRIVDDNLSTFTKDYNYLSQVVENTVEYDATNKEYRFIMTRELQAILNGEIENIGYRVNSPAFYGSSIERIIFNGSNTSLKNKPRLEITYTEY